MKSKDYPEGNYINGEWRISGSGAQLEVMDKYSGGLMASIPQASESDMNQAISAAQNAFETTKNWSAGKRAEMMKKLYQKLEENQERIIATIVDEAAKPLSYAETEMERVLATLDYAIHETLRFGGEVIPMDFANGEGKTAFTKPFPIGAIACICPFNFPLNLVMHKVAPALAVGCTMVIKPAPQAPLSCLILAELMHEVGYPAGVINVLCCENEVAEIMVKDDGLAMLSFTGSDKVGWYLKEICGKKKVSLELGGNAAVLIDKDVDVKAQADLIAKGAFLYAGQICISTQRIFVHQQVFEAFKEAFIAAVKELKVGDPKDKDTLVGPIIDAGHLQRIHSWVEEAKSAGADVLLGGEIESDEHHLYQPTILSATNASMKVYAEEVFGPVVILEKVESFEKGIEAVNDAKYGLQVGVFTNHLSHFKLAFEECRVGGVMINNIPGFRIDHMPYGGVKDSGMAREGLKYAMQEMTESRLLVY